MPVGPYFADFLCRKLQLLVELDGYSHDLQPERDAAPDDWMAAHGYHLLRFANADVMAETEGVLRAIDEEIARLRALQAHP